MKKLALNVVIIGLMLTSCGGSSSSISFGEDCLKSEDQILMSEDCDLSKKDLRAYLWYKWPNRNFSKWNTKYPSES